ncbi:MAG: MgtC/SapB family protein [Oscillospiraceae bacterium]|nr:MgtC/SapB family protein [Oscillospiraceae bacterium]
MLSIFDFARELTLGSVAFRLVLAVVCGGVIGIEREFKRRTAGFRTHILLCLGACVTILTSQYMFIELKMYTDVGRLGAQVVAGIGFMGAGSIIVTNSKRVRGLTTAAGMWISAIIGLVCGAGYVECALAATVMVLLLEIVFIKLESYFTRKIADVNLYVEYNSSKCIQQIVRIVKEKQITLSSMEITRIPSECGGNNYCAILTFQTDKEKLGSYLKEKVSELENVVSVEVL